MPKHRVIVETEWLQEFREGEGMVNCPSLPAGQGATNGAYGNPLTEPCTAHCVCETDAKRTKLKEHKKKNGVKVKVVKDEVVEDAALI